MADRWILHMDSSVVVMGSPMTGVPVSFTDNIGNTQHLFLDTEPYGAVHHLIIPYLGDGKYVVELENPIVFRRIDNMLKAIGGLMAMRCDCCERCNPVIPGDDELLSAALFVVKGVINGCCGKVTDELFSELSNATACAADSLITDGVITKRASFKELVERKYWIDYYTVLKCASGYYSDNDFVEELMRYSDVRCCLTKDITEKIDDIMATITFNIAENQPPDQVPNITKSIPNGGSYVFTLSDFTTGFHDPEGDNFKDARIGAPDRGNYYINGTVVSSYPVVVTAAQIANGELEFRDDSGDTSAGTSTANYSASDTGSGQYSS